MLFNSLHFVFFLPVVVGVFFALPNRWRTHFLLIASYYFYMCWKPEYAVLIALSTAIDYFAGIRMGMLAERSARKKWLTLSLIANFGLLFAFKYFNFFNENVRLVLAHFNVFYDSPTFHLLLPVGISFYTFQTVSYSIDVYRGQQAPERDFRIFALYVSFFPQLVAGPIERSTRLMPQFYERQSFDPERAASGLRRILWGMFQKVVVADRLAIYVDSVYNNQMHHGGLTLIIATLFFVFQVYCDFAGYTNIAIGSARIMGYNLMENFRQPFFAKSVAEFWQRWHMSLLAWFRDYLYIPLGGNRVPRWRWYMNTMVVFVLCGLWHGAAWTYVITLALHGFFIVFGNITGPARQRIVSAIGLARVPLLHNVGRTVLTFSLFAFSLIFFRALSVSDAISIIGKLFDFEHEFFVGQPSTMIYGSLAIIALVAVDAMREFFPGALSGFKRQHVVVRFASYAAVVLSIITIGVFDGAQFIYFQF